MSAKRKAAPAEPKAMPPSRTRAARVARGQPRVEFSIPATTNRLIDRLAFAHGCTRSAIIVMAIGAIAGDLAFTSRKT